MQTMGRALPGSVLFVPLLSRFPLCIVNIDRIQLCLGLFIITPFITTIAENFGIYGTDNLLVPVTVLLLLS